MQLSMFSTMLIGAMLTHLPFVIAFLLLRPEPRKDHSIAMAVFFSTLLINGCANLISLFPPYEFLASVDILLRPLLMLQGPALYFYARALTSPEVIYPSRRDLKHLIPLGVMAVLIGFWFSLTKLYPPDPESSTTPDQLFGMQNVANCLVFSVVMTIYMVVTIRTLMRYRERRVDYFSNLEGLSLRWLQWMIGIFFLAWGINLVLILEELLLNRLQLPIETEMLISASWMVALSFMVIWQQPIYSGKRTRQFQDMPVATAADSNVIALAAKGSKSVAAAPKYQRSALDNDRSRRIVGKVERAMSEAKLYRNQMLNLRHLSDHVQVSENYLSQALNEYLGRSFYEYVNHWRIREACTLLVTTSNTIIDIGEEVGFNSRSTFNAAFRKETGMTPSDYRSGLAIEDKSA